MKGFRLYKSLCVGLALIGSLNAQSTTWLCRWFVGKPQEPLVTHETTLHRSSQTAISEIIDLQTGLTDSLKFGEAIAGIKRFAVDPKRVKNSEARALSDELDKLSNALMKIYLESGDSSQKDAALGALTALFKNNLELSPLSWETAPSIFYDYRFPDDLRRLALTNRNNSKARSGYGPEAFQDSATMRAKDLIPFLDKGRKEIPTEQWQSAADVQKLFPNRDAAAQREIFQRLVSTGELRESDRIDAIERTPLPSPESVMNLLTPSMGYKQVNVSMPLRFRNLETGNFIIIQSYGKSLDEQQVNKIREALKNKTDFVVR